MKTKFGAIVVAGSGKISGNVASHNRGGSYLRTKVTPVNPRSTSQLAVRSRVTSLAKSWAALTDAQRGQWNGAVGSFQKTNIFGDLKKPSGFNLYVKLNTTILATGGTVITTPPAVGATGGIGAISVTAAKGTPALSIAMPAIDTSVVYMKVCATAGVSAGKTFAKSDLRVISYVSGHATPINALTAYTTKFGAIPTAGTRITVTVTPINNATGQIGTPSQATCIVAA